MTTKITEALFKVIKKDLTKLKLGQLVKYYGVSISTLNKIKKAKDWDEYRGKIEEEFVSEKEFRKQLEDKVIDIIRNQKIRVWFNIDPVEKPVITPKWYIRLIRWFKNL